TLGALPFRRQRIRVHRIGAATDSETTEQHERSDARASHERPRAGGGAPDRTQLIAVKLSKTLAGVPRGGADVEALSTMLRLLRLCLSYLLFFVGWPALLAHPKLRRGAAVRLGLHPSGWPALAPGPRLLIHGASAGDSLALTPLARE